MKQIIRITARENNSINIFYNYDTIFLEKIDKKLPLLLGTEIYTIVSKKSLGLFKQRRR